MTFSSLKFKAQRAKLFWFSLFFIFLSSLLIFNFSFLTRDTVASHCPSSDWDCQIAEIQREIDALKPAHERNKEELAQLRKQLSDIQKRLDGIAGQLKNLEANIAEREEDLAVQEELLHARIRSFYMRARQYSPLIVFLASENATEFTRELSLREQVAQEDRRIIEEISEQLLKLREDKTKLERSRAGLKSLQAQVDQRADFLAGEVEKVETYISTLTARQQELLALKAGGFQISVGDTPPTLEPCSGPPGSSNFCDPPFRAAFAAFSFGAPHRKGMSQFGAKGRADNGQNAESILRAYYGNIRIETRGDLPPSINTTVGTFPFEDNYLMGIAEMPSTWNMEALKAQAIAARTYAVAYVGWRVGNPGGATGKICVTESCQVYNSSKAASPPDSWRQAVQATRGQILISNNTNEIISTWYASTAGGYTLSYTTLGHSTPGQWDADGGLDGWKAGNAWDKRGGSPWFYKGWYRKRDGSSCGRSHPWLTMEEMADILNARYVLDGKGGDASRISPVDTSCWGGNPYSMAELKAIGGYTNVSSVGVIYGNDGSTLLVTFDTNKGRVEMSGSKFKEAFNLRAPGYIGLKSSLFNIVKL